MEQRSFNDSQEIDFWISFYFIFQKLDLSVFVNLEKFQPISHKSELWSPKTSSFRKNKVRDKEANDIFWLYFNTRTFRHKSGNISYKNKKNKLQSLKVKNWISCLILRNW